MKAASLQEIRKELSALSSSQVLELCLRLVKSKKENKEFLTYLLFEAHDEHGFIQNVKNEIDDFFEDLPKASTYLTKKSLRKLLRAIAKYSRHTGSRQAEIEMLIHFCSKLKSSGIPIKASLTLGKLYLQQLKKISALLELLHEDLRYDYKKKLDQLI